MDNEHTKGPWKRENALIIGPDSTVIATICSVESNARLIAAAPDLLEACEQLLHLFEPADADERFLQMRVNLQERAKAAIAKAKKQP